MFFGFNPDRSKRNVNTPLPVTDGGTGAENVSDARDNLGVYSKDEVYQKTETYTQAEIDAKFTDGGWIAHYSGTTYNYGGTQVATYVKYRKVNGIVYVIVKAPRSQIRDSVSVLPAGYRPSYEVCEAAPICDTSEPYQTMEGLNRIRIKTNGAFAVEGNLSSSTILECAFTYPAA